MEKLRINEEGEEVSLNEINLSSVFFALLPIICVLFFYGMTEPKKNILGFLGLVAAGIYFLIFSLVVLCDIMDDSMQKDSFKNAYGVILHNILPGRRARNEKIQAFVAEQILKIREKNNEDYILYDKKFKISAYSLDQWVKEHVGKEKSLQSFFQEQVLGAKQLRTGLLFWSQIIPKLEKYDDFRTLLIKNPISAPNSQLNNFKLISKEEINFAFGNYNASQIKRLFLSAFSLRDYLEILSISQKHKLQLPVEVEMKELLEWTQEIEASLVGNKFKFPKDKDWIPTLTEEASSLGEIEFIRNLNSLNHWASSMRNCIKSYKEKILKGESYFFGITQEGEEYIIFELNKKGELVEAKKKANNTLSSHEEYTLRRLIQEAIYPFKE